MNDNNHSSMSCTRRDALKISAAGLAVSALAPTLLAAEKPKAKISLQLYSVRGEFKQGLVKVLEKVSKMGFEGVEFWGGSRYNDYSSKPAELKKILDDLNLIAAGTHTGTRSISKGSIKKTMDFHAAIGCKYLIVPGDGAFCHPERSKKLAETFNEAAVTLKTAGLYCGYHNHQNEIRKAKGEESKTWWDLFAERTSEDVVLQQDVGWTTSAGVDPVPLITRYPGRTKIVHFKPAVVRGDKDKKPIIGEDSVKWLSIIKACQGVGGTEWMTIEQEKYLRGKSSMECSELSLKGLKKILAEMKA